MVAVGRGQSQPLLSVISSFGGRPPPPPQAQGAIEVTSHCFLPNSSLRDGRKGAERKRTTGSC